jgi:O-antigen ligase
MPWQGGLHNIISTGNEIGYGFISGQPGREVSFVVCAYYLIAWRYDRRRRDGWLAALAFVLFLTGYGRIAIVGAAIGFVLILVTDRRGTRASGVAAASVLAVLALSLGGIESQFLNISGRTGSNASTVAGATSGHLSLWSQQLNLFLERPLTGVGSNPTIEQDVEARFSPFFTDPIPPTVERLDSDGSRGEGGWTGLVAQRGVVTGGALLALIALAISYCLSAFPASTEGKQDMTLLRAVIVASLIFYITDEVPFGIYTVSGYVLGQITMIAVVRAIVTHQGRGGDLAPRSAPAD